MAKAAHDHRGRFTVGNPGGPGRPRRPVEREYLRALNEAVSLDDWKEVVCAAVAQAKEGDSKARDWLARYLIGEQPPRLIDLAADDVAGAGIGTALLDALVKYVMESRHRSMCYGDDLREATRLLQGSLVGKLHNGEDGEESAC
jgi:hypothetical protein